MPYTPNNPLVPGDPYSYDLKWMVDEINKQRAPEQAAEEAKASAEAAAASAEDAASSASNAYASEVAVAGIAANIADPINGIVTNWLADNITITPGVVIDNSLSVAGAAADAKSAGSFVRSHEAALFSEAVKLDSTPYIWQMGKTINSSGSEITGAGMALTYAINVKSGTSIANLTDNKGVSNKTTTFFVHEYVNGVWMRRTSLDPWQIFPLDATTDSIRISYGYPTSESETMTYPLLETYFHTAFYTPLASKVDAQGNNIGLYMSKNTNLADFITMPGVIVKASGKDDDTISTYSKSILIPVGKGKQLIYKEMYALTADVVIAVYDTDLVYNAAASVSGQGSTTAVSGIFTMPADGFIRLSSKTSALNDTEVKCLDESVKRLNILVLGNSFSQDAFAYLPVVLEEMMPDYFINYGIAYTSGADLSTHVSMFNNNTEYTWFDYWDAVNRKWIRYTGTGGGDGMTLSEILALNAWDIIYAQPVTAVTADPVQQLTNVKNNIVTPGRQLLRILQANNAVPFKFIMGQWLGTSSGGDNGETVCNLITDAMHKAQQLLGIDDIMQIGLAIQNARTNPAFRSLGDAGNMLYDTHIQSGLPVIICAYTIALKICEYCGVAKSAYESSFEPTTANCIAINAYSASGMVTPLPMTHGSSVGVTAQYLQAAQEIASLTNSNPDVIIDCSDIIV